MVSQRTRNVFEYLCTVLGEGLASVEDVRKFIRELRELSDGEIAFLETALLESPFLSLDGGTPGDDNPTDPPHTPADTGA